MPKQEKVIQTNESLIPMKKKKKKSKIKRVLIIVLILGGVGAALYFNRYKIADTVKEIPLLNQIFKPLEGDQNVYGQLTPSQLIDKVIEIEKENTSLGNQLLDKNSEIQRLEEKIETLKTYETRYSDFLAQKEAWDQELAKANPELFIAQYELMNPELASQLYQELSLTKSLTKEQKQFANTIGEMDEVQAAKALEKLLPTDPELIGVIFKGMAQERQALILSSMTTQGAAQVIKIISPELENN